MARGGPGGKPVGDRWAIAYPKAHHFHEVLAMRSIPFALLLIAAPAAAADKPKQAPPAVVQKLLDCRALTDA
ncbi:MAG: hypothetical protein RIS17_1220 [Pseudomonadota bacterium]|jgi:hypothetical protein